MEPPVYEFHTDFADLRSERTKSLRNLRENIDAFIFKHSNLFFMKYFNLRLLVFLCFYNCCLHLTAQDKSELSLHGLNANVEVIRDKWGVNHIYAQNEHDLFFAQGYCAAKDRLFQFELWRRQSTGTLAEILGERELKRDMGSRLFKFRGDINKELQHYHKNGKLIIESYVEGVNTFIEEMNKNPENLPIEFKLLNIKPQKWTVYEVISRHQGLLGNATQELNIGRSVAKVGERKVKDIMWFHPKDPNLKLDGAIQADLLSKDILAPYNNFKTDVIFKKEDLSVKTDDEASILENLNEGKNLYLAIPEKEMDGSNNWVIGGSKTESGFPMLANDPHRKIAVPSLRYMVHLTAPGWNVIGGGEPEIPGVSIGHNEKGAWGLTIFETDGEDLFVYDLNPKNFNEYWYKGKWKQMEIIQDSFKVKNAQKVNVSFRYTVHGPVTFIDSVNKKAYSLRCAWLEPGGAPYLASLRIDQAENWKQFRNACSYSNIPGENMIWADRNGNIGWQAVGIVPIRKNFSGYVPVPGDGRFEWSGYLPISERPHSFNPSKGFFATANQNVTPDNYNHWDAIGYTWADPYRGQRLNDVIEKKKKMTLQDMAALQTDYYSIPASELVPFLKTITIEDSIGFAAKEKLMHWDYRLEKTSIAAAIYVMWEKQILANANNQFIPKEIKPWMTFQLKKVIERVKNPEEYFGKNIQKDRDDFLKRSFVQAIDSLKVKLGNSITNWQYGQEKYKHITFEHQLSTVVNRNLKKELNIGPLPRGGNSQTTCSTGATDNQIHGASFRILIDTKDWDKTLMINTPGQSGDYKSPFYNNLFSLWANDGYFPAYFSKEKILEFKSEISQLRPK